MTGVQTCALPILALRKQDAVSELLEFYMGKNTMERQTFIIDNLVVEDDTQLASDAPLDEQ